jgi:hypothetical protein
MRLGIEARVARWYERLTLFRAVPRLTSVIVSTLLAKRRQAEQERLEQMLVRIDEHLTRLEQAR